MDARIRPLPSAERRSPVGPNLYKVITILPIIISRKAEQILINSYELIKDYQHEFELVSHTLYNQKVNKVNLI